MTQKITALDQITYEPQSGMVLCRFRPKTVYEDGEVQEHPPHRLALHPGADVDTYVRAINEHFERGVTDTKGTARRYAPINSGDVALIKAMVAQVHTKEAVNAYLKRAAE